jgi:alkaline phosphatase
MNAQPKIVACCLFILTTLLAVSDILAGDTLRELQERAVTAGRSEAAHWGIAPDNYSQWTNHTNRLIPVYTFGTLGAGKGIDLTDYVGTRSVYRNQREIIRLYDRLPAGTLNKHAIYMDQTNVFDIQWAALEAGKKYIFLVIFDGMDWQTTRAAAIYNQRKVSYCDGRGQGTHFQEFTAGGTSQFGWMVTAPHNVGTQFNVDRQTVANPGGTVRSGYDALRGGAFPWSRPNDLQYLTASSDKGPELHPYTDSACAATSMTTGIKTYYGAINVSPTGHYVTTIAHRAQRAGYRVGAVSSVPISHATPAASYGHNVHRDDVQDLTRDLLGLPSISHPNRPLLGLDVLIGGGFGVDRSEDPEQGSNFVPGNAYLTAANRKAVDVDHGGRYVVATRTPGRNGGEHLQQAATRAASDRHRLFGFFGVGSESGHLPYATADGDYQPAVGREKTAEAYNIADLIENPTLAEMTTAALTVLQTTPKGFWLMVESGDIDWANHDNNLDNSIGAVNSGDEAVKVITAWVQQHSSWQESLMIVTADHGHLLNLTRPELLVPNQP